MIMNILLHLDEILLKGANQKMFTRALINNLKALFPGTEAKRTESGGLWISGMAANDCERLTKIPGIANFAPAVASGLKMEEIIKAVSRLKWPAGTRTFRVSASRADKRYPLTSMEVNREVGDYIRKKYGLAVNLSAPDIDISIHIESRAARIYNELKAGIGGLPTGTAGKVMCLLSGGIDSPLAAYFMMKRGAEVELIHFQNETRVTAEVAQKISDLAKVLSRYQPVVRLHIAPFADLQRQIVMKAPATHRMLVTRRLMLKIAEELAGRNKCLALCTGDSLGQVASQTLANLQAVYGAVRLLVLPPLIGVNKADIMKMARHIGTLDISNRPYEDCCSLFTARHPVTRANAAELERLEQGIVLPPLDKLKVISYNISMDL